MPRPRATPQPAPSPEAATQAAAPSVVAASSDELANMAIETLEDGVEIVKAPLKEDGTQMTAREVLKMYGMWEGWATFCKTISIGPNKVLELPRVTEPDPEVVGWAFPLNTVEYALRNERKFPGPTVQDMNSEMFKLVNQSLVNKMFNDSYILGIIFNHINRNSRDSEGWQRAFIKVGGIKKLYGYATSDESKDRYWTMAILGRMLGTSAESRDFLLKDGAVDFIVEGTKDEDLEVRESAICALKGLIQFADGRAVVSYDLLVECLTMRSE